MANVNMNESTSASGGVPHPHPFIKEGERDLDSLDHLEKKSEGSELPSASTEAILADFSTLINKVHQDGDARLSAVMALSESKTTALSQQFRTLSENAGLQANYLNQLINIAQTVNVRGEDASIQDVSSLLHRTFLESINCILEISKQAMLMVYILNDGTKNLNEIEKSIRQIEVINHKTKYLSINATIEAVRAGEAGESFQVVASEVRDLSNDTQRLAVSIRGQVNQMTETLTHAQEILQKVASIDMSTNMLAKEQLDEMMEGLIDNSEKITTIASDASKASKEFSDTTRQLVTDVQYQDRMRQDLTHIQESIGKIKNIGESLNIKPYDDSLQMTLPLTLEGGMGEESGENKEILKKLMEPNRSPFSMMVSSNHQDNTTGEEGDDIELF